MGRPRPRLADYHRRVLAASTVKQLVLTPSRAVLIVEREAPTPYTPTAVLALDTNERSLDGVLLEKEALTRLTVPFEEVARIQQTHFARRRRLGRKKAHDRRVGRRLGGREGRRERHRVGQRLHAISNGLLKEAQRRGAALVLEELTGMRVPRRGRRLRRRLSSWPRRELHRQLDYKAEELGVPVVHVNPRYTSTTCPRCGEIPRRRSRAGPMFECDCGWRCDRQVNAGLNIGRTALLGSRPASSLVALGGLWLGPDALSEDARRLLYLPGSPGRHGRSGGRGRNEVAHRTR